MIAFTHVLRERGRRSRKLSPALRSLAFIPAPTPWQNTCVRALVAMVVILGGCVSATNCGPAVAAREDATAGDAARSISLPPLNGELDYQLGGAYAPRTGVTIVSRDREATPAPGIYNICYINGFQIQPAETTTWMSQHPDLILRDGSGQPVIDSAWNEILIDISTCLLYTSPSPRDS